MVVVGYIACFLVGAGVSLTAVFLCRFYHGRERENDHEVMPKQNIREEKLREQWINFLNYDGTDQNGVM